MKQIDLDDLPPRVAQTLASLEAGETLTLVQNGVVVARLAAEAVPLPPADDSFADQPPEERVKEVLEQFNAMIHDEF
jgi:antitoxin (DNA-binding transcriptional repressor) of toxin-antitoxin stability system